MLYPKRRQRQRRKQPQKPEPRPGHVQRQVPYDAEGRRLPAGAKRSMWLDLRDGQTVRITAGHNIQGARQPQYMHIGAARTYVYKGVRREPGIGQGRVVRRDEASSSFMLE